MAFNQQVTEEQATKIRRNILNILDGWLPYPTDYLKRKEEGWHKEYKPENKYVSLMQGYSYHKSWESCPKKQELIDYIKTLDFIDVEKALKTFSEITGIEIDQGLVGTEVEMKIKGKVYKAIIAGMGILKEDEKDER